MTSPQEERLEQAARLFHQAWALLDDLTALRSRLPEPSMPAAGRLPSDWNEFRSCAVAVDTLRASLRHALMNAITGFELRNEWQLRNELLPPSAKIGDPHEWLRRLDETMGGGEQEDHP